MIKPKMIKKESISKTLPNNQGIMKENGHHARAVWTIIEIS